MIVRRLGPDEVDAFRSLRLEALRLEPDSYASNLSDWEALDDAEWRRRLTACPTFVVEDGAIAVGLAGILPGGPSRTAHRATLIMVYVRKPARGTPAAAVLINGVADHARKLGYLQLEAAVAANNPRAIAFYEREGFRTVGTIPRGFRTPTGYVDEHFMVRDLD